jgi:HAD superfamily hydrolase (TIGR01490 family)
MLLGDFLFKLKFIALINTFFPAFNPSKRLTLWQLRGVAVTDMENCAKEFEQTQIRSQLIPELMEQLRIHRAAGDQIIIISGGYEPYLNYFAEKEGISVVMGTKMKARNGKLLGTFDGADCLKDEKVFRLNDWLLKQKANYRSSVVYSDSATDMPLFDWVDEPVVVSNKKSQGWAQKLQFKEIIHQ